RRGRERRVAPGGARRRRRARRPRDSFAPALRSRRRRRAAAQCAPRRAAPRVGSRRRRRSCRALRLRSQGLRPRPRRRARRRRARRVRRRSRRLHSDARAYAGTSVAAHPHGRRHGRRAVLGRLLSQAQPRRDDAAERGLQQAADDRVAREDRGAARGRRDDGLRPRPRKLGDRRAGAAGFPSGMSASLSDYLERSLNAAVYDVAIETALEPLTRLSVRAGSEVLLKREDTQPVFSFKVRGAYNKMVRLSPEALARGVVAASAGNHAQGVALAAQRLGCPAWIVMPVTTPTIKIDAVRARGANAELVGETYADAAAHALVMATERGLTFVHPYDDPDVIAGQGTIGLEILRQAGRRLDAVFIPIGGGGLAAGVGAVVKRLRPDVRVIGVEPDDADSMARSIREGKRVVLDQVGLFADGVAVRQVGEETFRICREVL